MTYQQRIFAHLSAGATKPRHISDAMGYPVETVYLALQKLLKRGCVTRANGNYIPLSEPTDLRGRSEASRANLRGQR